MIMGKFKKIFLTFVLVIIATDTICYFYLPQPLWWGVNIITATLTITLLLANQILKKTNWYKDMFVDYYHEIYPSNHWYRKHDERNFDIVALGSSGTKYAYDFTDCGIKGMNWGQQPQTLIDDFKLLKTFHSILRKKGIVLINIMPFTSCNKSTRIMDTYKYLGTYYEAKYFDQRFYKKAYFASIFPILFRKPAIKALINYLTGKDYTKIRHPENQKMSKENLKENARIFIDGWKEQFGITDFDAPLTESNKQGRATRLQVMRDMIDFIYERDYIPVYVIPPVTEHLSAYYSEKFKYTYIHSFLKEVNRDVKLLDYSNDKNFTCDNLYFNSFFLNKIGAKKFTRTVLTDLGLI